MRPLRRNCRTSKRRTRPRTVSCIAECEQRSTMFTTRYSMLVRSSPLPSRRISMEKMIVVVFENQSKAVAGLHALRGLSGQGEISVYDAQVVAREPNGAVRVVDKVDLSGFPEIVGG